MKDLFFYVHFTFIPKMAAHKSLIIHRREAVVEVPEDLVQRKQSELTTNSREKAIALELARRAARVTVWTGLGRIVWPYDEDALW
jgi:hypothetical protein